MSSTNANLCDVCGKLGTVHITEVQESDGTFVRVAFSFSFCHGLPAILLISTCALLSWAGPFAPYLVLGDEPNPTKPPRIALSALQTDLQADDDAVRANAATKIAEYGPDAKPAVPALIRCVTDKSAMVRQKATEALLSLGSDPIRASDADLKADLRTFKWRILWTLHPDPGTKADRLQELFLSAIRDSDIRKKCSQFLKETEADSREAVGLLNEAASSPDAKQADKEYALAFLSRFGPRAEPALATAKLIFADRANPMSLRFAAARAITSIARQDKESLRGLADRLGDPKEPVRLRMGLAELMISDREFGRHSIPVLVHVLKSPPEKGLEGIALREFASLAIADQAVPKKMLDDLVNIAADINEDSIIRHSVLKSIAKGGKESSDAIPGLVRILTYQSLNQSHADEIITALIRIDSKEAVLDSLGKAARGVTDREILERFSDARTRIQKN